MNMKWIFYMIMVVVIPFRRVYADELKELGIKMEKNGNDYEKFFVARTRKGISCKYSATQDRVEWLNPSGEVVKPLPTNRIFIKDHFVKHPQSAIREKMLIFNEILVQDSGLWQCRSGDQWRNISICVLDPVKFEDIQEKLTVDEGRSISLTCKTKGDPEPRMAWYRHGEIIAEDDNSMKYKTTMRYQTEGLEGFLTIISLEPEDSGVYTCIASQENQLVDDCSHSASYNITLNVNYGPKFEKTNSITMVYASRNERFQLRCDANGYPTPTIRWFHDLGDILLEISDNSNRTSLFLKADDDTFGKNFSCQAANQYGISYKHFNVLLLEKPKKPTGIHLLNSSAHSIDYKVSWLDDKVLFPVDTFELLLMMRRDNNDWTPPYRITVSDFESDNNAKEYYVTLPGLFAETEYKMQLRATNDAGNSEWSDSFIANTTAPSDDDKFKYSDISNIYDDLYIYVLLCSLAVIVLTVLCIIVAIKYYK